MGCSCVESSNLDHYYPYMFPFFTCFPLCFNPSSAKLTDVDECAEVLHGCHPEEETCRNTAGAYECDLVCEKGFQFSPALRSCVGEYVSEITRLMYNLELLKNCKSGVFFRETSVLLPVSLRAYFYFLFCLFNCPVPFLKVAHHFTPVLCISQGFLPDRLHDLYQEACLQIQYVGNMK